MSIVSIIGRPNVGKSTIFNRFTESKNAITSNVTGTTRDRNYGQCTWNGTTFILIDTGGYIEITDNVIDKNINKQIKIAINESDITLFVVDAKTGPIWEDKVIANILRQYKKKIILVPNKSDNYKLDFASYEFMTLGFDNIFPISAINGSGTGDLLDYITENIKQKPETTDYTDIPRFAIIGQPNVGKSSLTNTLLGDNRSIVNDNPGTTRDSIDSIYNLYNKKLILVDTAGIRKNKKNLDNIEFYSTLRSIKALENCDICLYIIDAELGIESEDLKLINIAAKNKKGIIIIVNKWDLIDKNEIPADVYRKGIYNKLKNLSFIPIIFVSALKKTNIYKIIEKGLGIYKNKTSKIKTSELNDKILPIIQKNPPSSKRGKEIKIKYITQLPTTNTTFAFFCNRTNEITPQYKSFLRNKIYENFNLEGVPISLVFKDK